MITSKHQALYNALNVKAVKGNAGINGQMMSTKAVGGLVCTESILRIPQEALPFYSCSMSPDANSQEIYKALKVRAHAENPGIGGKSQSIS